MKYFIMLLVIIPLALFAQDKKDNSKTALDTRAEEWMMKISSDPEMRDAMMTMILDELKGNKEEMSRLGITIMDNPGLSSVITGMMRRNINSDNMTIPHREMMRDSTSIKTMKMSEQKSYKNK